MRRNRQRLAGRPVEPYAWIGGRNGAPSCGGSVGAWEVVNGRGSAAGAQWAPSTGGSRLTGWPQQCAKWSRTCNASAGSSPFGGDRILVARGPLQVERRLIGMSKGIVEIAGRRQNGLHRHAQRKQAQECPTEPMRVADTLRHANSLVDPSWVIQSLSI